MECSPEDLPEAMNNREKWRESVKDIRACGTTWWWWHITYNSYLSLLMLYMVSFTSYISSLLFLAFFFIYSLLMTEPFREKSYKISPDRTSHFIYRYCREFSLFSTGLFYIILYFWLVSNWTMLQLWPILHCWISSCHQISFLYCLTV